MTQTPNQVLPPEQPSAPILWLKENLFSSWHNTALTLISISFIAIAGTASINWVFNLADWEIIEVNFRLFLVGRYPSELYWRIWTVLGMVCFLGGASWGIWGRFSRNFAILTAVVAIGLAFIVPVEDFAPRVWTVVSGVMVFAGFFAGQALKGFKNISLALSITWFLSFFVTLWLVGGGLGLEQVRIDRWNGLLLTLIVAVVGIVLSFPFGVLFALGRQSKTMPIVKWFCTIYIEVIRGLPLIGILFFAKTMMPLIVPKEISIDAIVQVTIGFIVFTSAYLAENVRGGLQGTPRGQEEAARALGLNVPLSISLIVLPQALKAVIPAIVGQFISLFKDTALLGVLRILDFYGMARSILAQPEFTRNSPEGFIFIGLVYWVFCYAMSMGSQKLEKTLQTGR
ncbi:neutral amino acid ABC transporter membrane protein,L-aspartate ABC transporter membrane protein,L-glutamate ABC transporter membrane protein [Thalassoporum mexicanum PCC 7367]|uniref:amino acid ABC transporter permease n=1 Tax=Thalassoporum mexicanum TaxID=3457544 RepID=UPI00029FC3C1|nr:amino acid ABC transporter permease [Pseudanabaena sp. PCC 7367]AFY70726.1 neutral amino acid ABC transporter membrane protein,L-aspartate ABC transporter membrane protein,L-glutamate ABC transporter membrane protein [Pseudanabaena sp. PCC 7367]